MKRFFLIALILTSVTLFAEGPQPTPQEIIAKYLASIGTPEARKSVEYYEWLGKATVRSLRGGNEAPGTATLISEGDKVKFALKFNTQIYPDEQVVYDGRNVQTSFVRPGERSPLGQFLWWRKEIVSDGLLGGPLSVASPLYDPKLHGGSISFKGLKKVDGKDLYQLSYRPKKADSSLEITMYFDPATFHLIRVNYDVKAPPRLEENATQAGTGLWAKNDQQQNAYFHLQEDFGDYTQLGNLTLPLQQKMNFSADGAVTESWFWQIDYTTVNGNKIPGR